jgi:di/tricarboxylate transporter
VAVDALTPDMLLVLAILAGAIALFVTEVVRIDVAAILVMVVVGLTQLVPAADVFAGFASNAVISIIAVMILGAGLDRVGVMRQVAAFLLRVGGATERRVLVSISSTVGPSARSCRTSAPRRCSCRWSSASASAPASPSPGC